MEDHGDILTHFEFMFGSNIEHEVIKIILQSCDWDKDAAMEKLLNLHDGIRTTPSMSSPNINTTQVNDASNESLITAPPVCCASNKVSSLCQFDEPEVHSSYANAVSMNCFEAAEMRRNSKSPCPANTSRGNSISPLLEANLGSNYEALQQILQRISSGERIFILIRGLPGSGKSTLARKLISSGGIVLSSDDYFVDRGGVYKFNPLILHEAHNWNKDRAKNSLHNRITPIIIDNTNIQAWEMEPYIKYALGFNYSIEILEPDTPWKYNVCELARKTIHGVPAAKIEMMKENFKIDMYGNSIIKNMQRMERNSPLSSENIIVSSRDAVSIAIPISKTETVSKSDNISYFESNPTIDAASPILYESSNDDSPIINSVSSAESVPDHDMVSSIDAISINDSSNCEINGDISTNIMTRESPSLNDTSKVFDLNLQNVSTIDDPDVVIEDSDTEGSDLEENNYQDLGNNDGRSDLMKINLTQIGLDPVAIRLTTKIADTIDSESLSSDSNEDISGISAKHVTDQDFDSMVKSMGESVQNFYIDKSQTVFKKSDECEQEDTDYTDDITMYNFCDTMESKLGKSILSLRENEIDVEKLNDDCQIESIFEEQTPGKLLKNDDRDEHLDVAWDIDKNMSNASWSDIPLPKDLPSPSALECRQQSRRADGDPDKWLNAVKDKQNSEFDEWVPTSHASSSWNDPSSSQVNNSKCENQNNSEPSPASLTGAIPKNNVGYINISKPTGTLPTNLVRSQTVHIDCSSQVNSSDFNSISADYSIIYGSPDRFVSANVTSPLNKPLTTGILKLDKSSYIDSDEFSIIDKNFLFKLMGLFPSSSENELKDILEKCNYNLDWAVNILIDGGYEMSNNCNFNTDHDYQIVDTQTSQLPPLPNPNFSPNNDYSASASISSSHKISSDEKFKKVKQSLLPEHLQVKKEIETSFSSGDVDDRTKRLTGKEFDKMNIGKIKQRKGERLPNSRALSENETPIKQEVENFDINVATDVDGSQFLTLQLDSVFASQLMNIFGPVGPFKMNSDMALEDRCIVLPLDMCKKLHACWTESLSGKIMEEANVFERLINDEKLARELQNEENSLNNEANDNGFLIRSDFNVNPPDSFKEIMDTERAIERSKMIDNKVETSTLSSLISLKKLKEEFSHVDTTVVENVFDTQDKNYQLAFSALDYKFSVDKGIPKIVLAPGTSCIESEMVIPDNGNESVSEIDESDDWNGEQIIPDDPKSYRDEAQIHYYARQNAYHQAKEATGKGMPAVAAYYAHIGRLHTQKLQEANARASQKIFEYINANKDANMIDLHLLHIPEALRAVSKFLIERQSVLMKRKLPLMSLSLVTGYGSHNQCKGRLKPAIKEYLKNGGYSFYEGNRGMLVVTLKNPNS